MAKGLKSNKAHENNLLHHHTALGLLFLDVRHLARLYCACLAQRAHQIQEQFIDVRRRLRGCFEERTAELACEGGALLLRDLAFVVLVALVAHQHEDGVPAFDPAHGLAENL